MKLRRRRIRQLVRQFKENGMKMMLEHPANVRDVLRLLHIAWLDQIDFDRLEHIKTTFIRRDYRHLESDIVLTAPLIGRRKGRRNKLLIYILIEHQSDPDRLMPMRLADAQLQVFRYQVRKWSQTHGSTARLQLMPVLPVVFYTGLRRWAKIGTLTDLIAQGEEFRPVTPIVEQPLFLNLPEVDGSELEREGGYFGWLLRLVQQRKSRSKELAQLVEHVVAHLNTMPPEERERLSDMLSYIGAMIYHERSTNEQARFQQAIERSIQNEALRQEVSEMGKSMADVMMEKGRNEGRAEGRTEGRAEGRTEAAVQTRQQMLIRLLRKRFGEVPANVVSAVSSTTDVDQLDEWLDRLVTADTLGELGIPATD